jgi:hypothetical protein
MFHGNAADKTLKSHHKSNIYLLPWRFETACGTHSVAIPRNDSTRKCIPSSDNTLLCLQHEDAGEYRCKATNDAGSDEATAYLTVRSKWFCNFKISYFYALLLFVDSVAEVTCPGKDKSIPLPKPL